MKVLWHSGAPWAPTGYGQQTATFAPRLQALGHELILSSVWGLDGATLEWNGMPVLPRDQRYGNVTLPQHAERYKPDLVIALLDAWVFSPDRMRDLPLAVWAPVDHKPCPPKVAEFFRLSGARPIAMSRFGEQMFRDEGLDPLYVPHGVDTSIFTPDQRDTVRERTGLADSFVVGIVANNAGGKAPTGGPPRKAFPQSLMAFSEFHRSHPDARLYLHCEMTGRPGLENGVNLVRMLDQFEIPADAVMITNQLAMDAGIQQHEMAALYSSFDVLLNPSYGEGFGIPIVEAQACGTPVIVTDWTAMPELVGAGWAVGGDPWYDPDHEAFYRAPAVGEILAALEQSYEARGDMDIRGAAREFALEYDADKVTADYWVPALDALSGPREVPPLPNRAMRRAAAKAAA